MRDAMAAPSPVLYVTYAASALHEHSGTHRKLESIAADFAATAVTIAASAGGRAAAVHT